MNFIQPYLLGDFIVNFITESNGIEGIYRDPTFEELEEYVRFLALPTITIPKL